MDKKEDKYFKRTLDVAIRLAFEAGRKKGYEDEKTWSDYWKKQYYKKKR